MYTDISFKDQTDQVLGSHDFAAGKCRLGPFFLGFEALSAESGVPPHSNAMEAHSLGSPRGLQAQVHAVEEDVCTVFNSCHGLV